MAGSSQETINLKLRVWQQRGPEDTGGFLEYAAKGVSTEMSFLEMLDVMNEDLIHQGKDPVEFDHDCREGICGMCSLVINGSAHGKDQAVTTCQLHMRRFTDGETVTIEPFRASAFPIVRDLVVDRSSFDRIIQSGGYVSVTTGSVQDANNIPVGKGVADQAMNAAACIGCGACVAACPNASASLFVSAKITHLGVLPQGVVEKDERALNMVHQMDEEGFGGCTNIGACSTACPKEISLESIAIMNRNFSTASIKER